MGKTDTGISIYLIILHFTTHVLYDFAKVSSEKKFAAVPRKDIFFSNQ